MVLDYSTDGSWKLCQSIASADLRFRLYQVPRDRLYAPLNRGMEALPQKPALPVGGRNDTHQRWLEGRDFSHPEAPRRA
jgi:hypothetical protein